MAKPALFPSLKKYATPLLIALITATLMFVTLVMIVTPDKYDISIGAPASTTIFATKDVEDTITTQKLRDSAADAVSPSYSSVDHSITTSVMNNYTSTVNAVLMLRDEYTYDQIADMGDSDLAEIEKKTGVALSKADLGAILTIEDESDTLADVLNVAKTLLQSEMNSTLPEGQESGAINRITRSLTGDGYPTGAVNVTVDVIRAVIRPNMLIDEETTEVNRQNARDAVEPQVVVKGEAVVREGDIVTEAKYQILVSLGMVQESTFDIQLYSGLLIFVICCIAAIGIFIAICYPELLGDRRMLTIIALIILIVMAAGALTRQINVYLMPVSLGIMLLCPLFDRRLAVFVNFMLGIVMSLFASMSTGALSVATFAIIVANTVAGTLVIMILSMRIQRSTMLLAGLAVGVSNFITVFGIGLVNSADYMTIAVSAAWSAGSGLLASVMAVGIQPLLESVFNLVTNARLLELSNPNQPLLHRLLLEAPGTYHHSIIVANLADAAANAIGANALLARVGAYYHDIGKLKRPMYFAENQTGDNPHDRCDPRMSSVILTSHTKDGAALAKESRLPQEIIDIIQQHHGDSPVIYFYDKAKKLYGDDIDIALFRYEGPRPKRRETAIVMLADMVEAATRSNPTHDPVKITEFVSKLIRGKLNDGQLDESNLTFSDLDRIRKAFITVLTGVFHERVEYPDVKLPPRPAAAPIQPAESANAAPETSKEEVKAAEAAQSK